MAKAKNSTQVIVIGKFWSDDFKATGGGIIIIIIIIIIKLDFRARNATFDDREKKCGK